jgi:hypothetical protein
MAYEQPVESLDTPMRSRSLNIVLGVTEYLFIAGFVLLAVGLFLKFGFACSLIGCGFVLIVTAVVDAVVS